MEDKLSALICALDAKLERVAVWQSQHEVLTKTLTAEIERIKLQFLIVKWALGVVTAIAVALVVAWARNALNI